MADRVTVTDVRRAFGRHVELCERFGLVQPGGRFVLSEGSKTYGNAYRINVVGSDGGTGHHRPLIGDDFLGMTAAEALNTLRERTRVLEDLADLAKVRTEGDASEWRERQASGCVFRFIRADQHETTAERVEAQLAKG